MSNREKSFNNWVIHDSNAKDDYKCMLLIEQLGLEGYGIFWVAVETLREQKNYKYPLHLIGALARKYNTTEAKMLAVIKDYQLFELDESSFFFSSSLNRRMESYEQTIEKRRIAGKKSGEARRKKSLEHKLNTCSSNDELREDKRKEDKRKELLKLKEHVLSKSPQELYQIYIDKDYELLFNKKINSRIEKDKGFSQLKLLLENDDYDNWFIKEFL